MEVVAGGGRRRGKGWMERDRAGDCELSIAKKNEQTELKNTSKIHPPDVAEVGLHEIVETGARDCH